MESLRRYRIAVLMLLIGASVANVFFMRSQRTTVHDGLFDTTTWEATPGATDAARMPEAMIATVCEVTMFLLPKSVKP
jgi:hypothetical protein